MSGSRRPSTGGFKAFLTKSNALALAIGVIIGGALGAVVNSLVNDIIMPPIGWALGGVDFATIKTVLGTTASGEEVAIGWGLFINALIVVRHRDVRRLPDRHDVHQGTGAGPDQGLPVLLRGEQRGGHEVQGLRQRDLAD